MVARLSFKTFSTDIRMVLFIFLLHPFLIGARQGKNKDHSFLHTLLPSDDR